MFCNTFFTLPGNIKMPAVGLGTSKVKDDILDRALEVALEAGYRHIDTAETYNNEEVIGKVLKRWFDSGKLKREEIFITTKLSPHEMHPDKVEECLKESLKRLQLEYVDLYLIHFPFAWIGQGADIHGDPNVDYIDVWKTMEEQYDAARAKSVGVANFSIKKIERLLKNCRILPAVNQIEVNVYLQQRELVDFCTTRGINIVAHCPLRSSRVPEILNDETIRNIGKRHNKTPTQIALRFLLQAGVASIPKSVTPERIRENMNIFDFSLSEEDMVILRKLEIGPQARVCHFRKYGRLQEHPDFEF